MKQAIRDKINEYINWHSEGYPQNLTSVDVCEDLKKLKEEIDDLWEEERCCWELHRVMGVQYLRTDCGYDINSLFIPSENCYCSMCGKKIEVKGDEDDD